jgi:hypothetical protein
MSLAVSAFLEQGAPIARPKQEEETPDDIPF